MMYLVVIEKMLLFYRRVKLFACIQQQKKERSGT